MIVDDTRPFAILATMNDPESWRASLPATV